MTYRDRLIKAIHTGRSRLGLDEEEYRLLIRDIGNGRESSKDLNIRQLRQVLDRLREAGFASRTTIQERKIQALWRQMFEDGIVRSDANAAISAYVKRICGKPMKACTSRDLSRVIETLKQWIARVEAKEDRDRLDKEESREPLACVN